ncbi:DinB family protein [Chitinophaga agrisoli]|uniref:DinB family protein n=1 Tax=Chitinophaga agrisoli TaxID=2607653 RepID=A0A5B2VU44_9BACT|nr:DinB family protein [Chitinophaga agrisoli]KAA2243323.1 DinB family protein [Chitinophaga agrisoli]
MNPAANLITQFNHTIDQWIAFLDDYTLEMLCQPPREGSWSLGQVYRHIIDDTNYQVEQMLAAAASTANSEGEMRPDGQAMFLRNSFPDIMIEGPATGSYIPQPADKVILRQELLAIRKTVNDLHTSTDLNAAAGKTEHPGFRFFSALEWLQFVEMHMRHHLRQKQRIDGALLPGEKEQG